jgi:hypothetical protein
MPRWIASALGMWCLVSCKTAWMFLQKDPIQKIFYKKNSLFLKLTFSFGYSSIHVFQTVVERKYIYRSDELYARGFIPIPKLRDDVL